MPAEIWLIARTELRRALRERETLVWVFVLPFVFFYFLGSVAEGYQSMQTGRGSVLHLVVDGPRERAELVDSVRRALEDRGYRVRLVPRAPAQAERILHLPLESVDPAEPASTIPAVLSGRAASLRLGRENWRVASALEEAFGRLRPGTTPPPISMELELRSVGSHLPRGFEQSIPGNLVMFVLLVQMSSGGAMLFAERRSGALRRLSTTPLRRSSIVLGKVAGRAGLGGLQILVAAVGSTLLFDIRWGPQPLLVAGVLGCWLGVSVVAGLLLGNHVRTRGQALAGGVLVAVVLAALGGCWWPPESTPDWMQSVQRSLPTGWARNALVASMSGSAGPEEIAAAALKLAALALSLGLLGLRSLRRS